MCRKLNMKIREAVQADIQQIASLNAEVQAIHVELFPDSFHKVTSRTLCEMVSSIMSDESILILVAEEDSEIIGYLSLRKQNRPSHALFNGRNCGYIDQVCITKEHRGKGVFKSLLNKSKQVVTEWGFKRIELDVWSNNKAAKETFSNSGFETYNEKMQLEL
jgi:ribosomal protein S18 acetylase RimI-like enzyme